MAAMNTKCAKKRASVPLWLRIPGFAFSPFPPLPPVQNAVRLSGGFFAVSAAFVVKRSGLWIGADVLTFGL
jgi:hypothetical protein